MYSFAGDMGQRDGGSDKRSILLVDVLKLSIIINVLILVTAAVSGGKIITITCLVTAHARAPVSSTCSCRPTVRQTRACLPPTLSPNKRRA